MYTCILFTNIFMCMQISKNVSVVHRLKGTANFDTHTHTHAYAYANACTRRVTHRHCVNKHNLAGKPVN